MPIVPPVITIPDSPHLSGEQAAQLKAEQERQANELHASHEQEAAILLANQREQSAALREAQQLQMAALSNSHLTAQNGLGTNQNQDIEKLATDQQYQQAVALNNGEQAAQIEQQAEFLKQKHQTEQLEKQQHEYEIGRASCRERV